MKQEAPDSAPEDAKAKDRSNGRRAGARDELALAVLRLAESQKSEFAAFRDHLDAFGDRIAAVEARTAARPQAQGAPMFSAEKARFEHLLTGFRLALRDYADLPARLERADQSVQANSAALRELSERVAELAATPTGADQPFVVDLGPVETRLDALAGRIEATEAALAQRPAGPNAGRISARFEAEKAGFERILTGFRLVLRDLGQQVSGRAALSEVEPPSLDLGPVETRLDAVATRLQAIEEALSQRPASPPATQISARFEAEKVGFERILTGFRLVLRDLGQQASGREALSEGEPPSLDLGPVETRLDAVASRLHMIEEALAQRPAAPDAPRIAARFEAEKVGFERILTGFRLVLRDFGQQASQLSELVRAPAEPLAIDLGPVETRIDALASHLQAVEDMLGQLSAQPDPVRPSVRFEAEKVGFERILTGFRLVLRDLSHQASASFAPETAGASDPAAETLAAILARLGGIEAALAVRAQPERSRASALFEAEKVGFERLLEGFRMVLRDFSQQAGAGRDVLPALTAMDARLALLAQRLEAVPKPTDGAAGAPPSFDPQNYESAHLRAGVVLVMRQVEQAAQRLDEVVERLGVAETRLSSPMALSSEPASEPPLATTDMIARENNAAEPARLSLYRLLGGYRFILAALQREAERLQGAVARAPAAPDVAARIEAAVARLEALAPASTQPETTLDEAVLRLKMLGLRMARKVEAAPDEDLRGQTVELLAISDALVEEMRRRA
ncbi:hypothetical protein M2322_004623 [Rhodoblastus acidophilus]|uniref:hypothetical protein n=1 Tax=Rhodoblastus acidophilus TaxID=1074 RepID=UPI002224CBBE|nr:hypothetical protein [Rhodoblastus acidophilus]MCW2319054.1 hypothetical protein [Rhodoblastus acidophilus]